jgi:hypothetical protein
MKGALSNPEAIKNLTNSILGVLEIDLAKDEVSFAALARVEFGKFLSLEAPLLLRFAFGDSRDWELALGTYKRPVQTHIDVFGILRGRAGGFFMAGGDGLDGVPVSGPGVMTGFAVAFGFFARLTIGKGTIYVRASSRTLLAASFGDALFAHGRMRIQGELMLIFVGVGVSADFSFVFLRPPSGDEAIAITGSVSGSVRIGWFKISGSLTIRIGGRISDRSAFPSLLRQVSILSGNNVSLFGQGTAGPIDGKLAVLPPAEPSGSTPERPEVTDVPLDAVIAMSFVTSPDLPGQQTSQTEGTLALAGVSAPGPRTVRFGSRTGRYVVDELSLTRLLPDGGEEPLPPERIPARWWESAQSRGDEPTALSLALFTRNPLGFENAAISSDTLRGWLKALDRNVCSSVPARRCLYTPGPGQQEKEGRWLMSPLPWESADTDRGAIDPVTVEALTPDGIEYDSLKPSGHDERLWFLRLVPVSTPLENGEVALDPPRLQLFCRAHHTEPVRLLLGLSSRQAYREVHIEITSRSGALRRSYTATDLDLEELRQEADGNWERAVEGFASLASEPETQDWVFGVIVVPTEDFSDHDPIATVTLSIKAAKLPHYAPLLFGGLSMLPSSEVERYAADEARRSSRLEELEEYLTGKDAPLLQANSLYRLYLSWSVKGDGDEHGDERFYFRTVSQPPTSADPYVLTHFPQSGESFHYAEQTPGIAFAGTEVFRILAQFPDARLRVRITTDDGTSLTDSDETSRWYDGVILDPEALVDPLKEPPPGILTKQIASLPSALRHALRQALLQQEGPLACVDGISLPSSGLWVGFDTALLPDKGYEVTVELVDADGKLWPHSTNEEHRRPFYRWMFRTGRYPSLRAHAAAIGSGVLRRRLLQGCDDGACLSFGEDRPSRIKTVPDKVFEDTVASAVGERWDRSTRNRRTLLCARNADKFEAVALLVESDSPLVRYTTAPTIKLLEEFNSHVAESTDHPLLEIDLNNSRGIEGVTLTASGFALLAYLEPGTDPATAGVAISTVPVDRIPVIAAETAFLGGNDE